MKTVFKGKIKYNFWIGIGYNLPFFMTIAFTMATTVIGTFFYFSPDCYLDDETFTFVMYLFAGYMGFCYLISCYYRYILRQWDKPGYEILEVDDEAEILSLDTSKIIQLSEIECICFKECKDYVPHIRKSYDTINAQAVIILRNGEKEVFLMQKLSWIYEMINYFRGLHIRVDADEFDDNPIHMIEQHTWKIYLILVLATWVYMIYKMYEIGKF